MRTSFHHQPEAQHPKSPAIETPAGRLPHLYLLVEQEHGQIIPLADIAPLSSALNGYAVLYPVHVTTRKSFGLMTRKLSVTESHRSAQFRGTFSRKKPSVASANWAQVA